MRTPTHPQHAGKYHPGGAERCQGIHLEGPDQLFVGQAGELPAADHPGTVDADVDAAQFGQHPVADLRDIDGIGQLDPVWPGLGTQQFELAGDPFQPGAQ